MSNPNLHDKTVQDLSKVVCDLKGLVYTTRKARELGDRVQLLPDEVKLYKLARMRILLERIIEGSEPLEIEP